MSHEILRDYWIIDEFDDTLEVTVGSFLDGLTDLFPGGFLFESAGQIDDGDVGGWNSEGHTCEFTLEFWDDFTNGFGSTSGRWDDVWTIGSSTSWVFLRSTIDGGIGGSSSMNGGHEAFNNTELIIDDLGERSKTVGGARSIRDICESWIILFMVNSINEHWSIVL